MIQKTKLKKKFNEAGLQITKEAINALDRKADLQVDSWVKMTKENNDLSSQNIKLIKIMHNRWNSVLKIVLR